jgi:hypothetical protein
MRVLARTSQYAQEWLRVMLLLQDTNFLPIAVGVSSLDLMRLFGPTSRRHCGVAPDGCACRASRQHLCELAAAIRW